MMSKQMDITSLNIDMKNLIHSDEDITLDELRLTTSDAMGELTPDELNSLKDRYKKITYTIMDMDMNRKGFGVTEEAMLTYVDHFHKTKDNSDLHGFFKDHDYKHIDSLMGRVVDTKYDPINKRVRRTALIDLRHPTAKRLDMFKNLSTTMMHGKKICSGCNKPFGTCDHIPDGEKYFPRSTVAFGIEDSLVTISGYPNAKRDSLSIFMNSLSSSIPDLIQDEEDIEDEDIFDKDKIAPSSNVEEDEEEEEEDIEDEVEDQKESKEEIEAYQQAVKDLKEDIEFLKNYIDKNM